MRRAAKVDSTQAAIVAALRKAGASVQLLHSVGEGCPDLLVGFRMRNILIECKAPTGSFTEDQVDWHRDWRGQVSVAHSAMEALEAIGVHHDPHRAKDFRTTPRWGTKESKI